MIKMTTRYHVDVLACLNFALDLGFKTTIESNKSNKSLYVVEINKTGRSNITLENLMHRLKKIPIYAQFTLI